MATRTGSGNTGAAGGSSATETVAVRRRDRANARARKTAAGGRMVPERTLGVRIEQTWVRSTPGSKNVASVAGMVGTRSTGGANECVQEREARVAAVPVAEVVAVRRTAAPEHARTTTPGRDREPVAAGARVGRRAGVKARVRGTAAVAGVAGAAGAAARTKHRAKMGACAAETPAGGAPDRRRGQPVGPDRDRLSG
ncbi:MAG: hypothetical protein OXH96_25810, partial [Spirochaetaceae bacterium]|nr:hypothetical protein [Spirochaetaceae bacterium]